MMARDVLEARRSLCARPSTTLGLVSVLVVGIALATLMFALAEPVLLSPLPYPEANRLASISLSRPRLTINPTLGDLPTVDDWAQRTDLFEAIAGYRANASERVRVDGRAAAIRRASATERFLDVLGVPVGRAEPGAVWLTDDGVLRLGGDRTRVPTLLRTDGSRLTVEGMLPRTFLFPESRGGARFDLLQIVAAAETRIDRGRLVARLRRGVEAAAVETALRATLPAGTEWRVRVVPLEDDLKRHLRPLASGAVFAGLLLLCVAVANATILTVGRCIERETEFAVRGALGASRWRILRLLFAELAVITAVSFVVALAAAAAGLALLARVMPAEFILLDQPSLTIRAVFVASLAASAVVVLGLLVPVALWSMSSAPRLDGRIASDPLRIRALRVAMIGSQTAVAMVLLTGASLLWHSQWLLFSRPTGYSGYVDVVSTSYDPSHLGPALRREIDLTIERLRKIPGVQAVAASAGGMLDGVVSASAFRDGDRLVPVSAKQVTPGYFETVGSTFIVGRGLQPADGPSSIVISESLVRQLGEHDFGAFVGRIVNGGRSTIVGIIRDEVTFALDRPPVASIFSAMRDPEPCVGSGCDNRVNYVIRTSSARDGQAIVHVVEQTIRGVNPDAIIFDRRPIDTRLADSVRDRSFAATILGVFGVAGLVLCAVGLFSVVEYATTRRTREIAIRRAIGASARHVLRVVLRESLVASAAGVIFGAIAGAWLSRTLGTLSYGVRPGDTRTLVAGGAVLIIVVIAAASLPARRALAISPADAMRRE